MSKTNEPKIIEKVLLKNCFGNNPSLAREYGSTEVTIGFQRDKKGKEIVDFLSYNAKSDIFRCYEIKVTMQDFNSSAKKSWYGHYNYLVITNSLFKQMSISEWKKEIPVGVGIIVVDTIAEESTTILKSHRQDITIEIYNTLKNSLIRTLFYQNNKKR